MLSAGMILTFQMLTQRERYSDKKGGEWEESCELTQESRRASGKGSEALGVRGWGGEEGKGKPSRWRVKQKTAKAGKLARAAGVQESYLE